MWRRLQSPGKKLFVLPGAIAVHAFQKQQHNPIAASELKSWRSEKEALFWRRVDGEGEFVTGATFRVLRQDPLTRRWILILTNKQRSTVKPTQWGAKKRADPRAHEQPSYVKSCPFCAGVGKEPCSEVLRVLPNGQIEEKERTDASAETEEWSCRVLRNKFPYLATPEGLYATPFGGSNPIDPISHPELYGKVDNDASSPHEDHPLYKHVDGFGASEVVVESPIHNQLIALSTDEKVANFLRAMARRGRTLRLDPRVLQLVYFKQYGKEAGSSLVHPHSQIITLPIVSDYLRTELYQDREFYRFHGCRAVQRLYVQDACCDAVGRTRLIRESKHFVASMCYAKHSKNIVIAPKHHRACFEDCSEDELRDLGALLRLVMAALYRLHDDPAYNLFWRTAPTRHASLDWGPAERAAVEECFSWSMTIRIPRTLSGFELASGITLTDTLPMDAAKKLREAIEEELRYPLKDELGLSES